MPALGPSFRASPSKDLGVLLRLHPITKIVKRPSLEIKNASFADGHWHLPFTVHVPRDRVRDQIFDQRYGVRPVVRCRENAQPI